MYESWRSTWIWAVPMLLKGAAGDGFRSARDRSKVAIVARSLDEVCGIAVLDEKNPQYQLSIENIFGALTISLNLLKSPTYWGYLLTSPKPQIGSIGSN
jgi:hypothetical protein